MKYKSLILTAVLALACAFGATAQTNTPLPVKGTLDIKFNSRVAKGQADTYSVAINVANSALFSGTITDTPLVMGGVMGNTVKQGRSLSYSIDCDVVNPKNPKQTRNVGRMNGIVPIALDGTYRYDTGSLEVSILPMGNAGGFTSKFGGTALGKPLNRPSNWFEKLKCEATSITRSVNGKTMTVILKKYDRMDFKQHVIGAGPVQIYQPVTVNGEMLYDYEKECWFFNNVTMQYADGGNIKIDRLSGTVRYVKSPQYKSNGESEYQFDIRVNEPPPNVSAAFETKASDESSFFETDTTVPALTGLMKYKDTVRGVTLASAVTVDLVGNNISKQQLMALTKIIIFSSVVPMNAD